MIRGIRFLLGISLFWLALSMLFDGINTLVLPNQLIGLVSEGRQATLLGLLTFFGLLAGMLVQPLAGVISDRTRVRWGRSGTIGIGLMLILVSLTIFGLSRSLAGAILGYLAIQVAASIAQAGQQGFIPDLVSPQQRGLASGWKGFMDIGGAMLGFVVLGQLLGSGQTGLAPVVVGFTLVVSFLVTVALVKEDWKAVRLPQNGKATSHPSNPLAAAFRLDLRQHRPFAWLVLSRFLFLLGTYAVGRFLLYFVAERLGLEANQAAREAGSLLALLALISILAAPPAGWAADRLGRIPLMVAGAILSALGTLLLIVASTSMQILLFGSLMSLGSAAFASANWAMTADLSPSSESARFFGFANFGTAGAAAAGGLFGILVDGANRLAPGSGYPALFLAATLASLSSALVLLAVKRSWAASSHTPLQQDAYHSSAPGEVAESTWIE